MRGEVFVHNKLLHRSFYTEKFFHTEKIFTHREVFTHRKLYTQQAFTDRKFWHKESCYTQRHFYTQKALHTASFYTQKALTQRKFLHKASIYAEKHLHKESFYRQEVSTHKKTLHAASFYTERFSCTQWQQKLQLQNWTKQNWRSRYNAICRDWAAKHNRTSRNSVRNCSSKSGSRRQSEKRPILKQFLKGILIGKSPAPNLRKSTDKSPAQPWCSHRNTIHDSQLKRQWYYAGSRSREEPWCSHYNAICRDRVAKHKRIMRNGTRNWSSKTESPFWSTL